jgi:glycosyltransferase involved in cell wall biosynthesis
VDHFRVYGPLFGLNGGVACLPLAEFLNLLQDFPLPPSVHLSLIIPAYNEEQRLPYTLEKTLTFIQQQPYAAEILIVENGSTDQTAEIAKAFAARHPQVTVLHESRPGKGNAVRRGMLAAQGTYRFMADADLSMPIEEVTRFLPPQLTDCDIAIASREAPGAVRYEEPAFRHWGGRAINTLIRLLALPGLHDTQCGFKCFRAPIAEDLFRHQTLPGWSFDIELLYIARLRGYRILEIPIPWHYRPESKVNPIRDAMRMALDILTIRKNAQTGKYAQAPQI